MAIKIPSKNIYEINNPIIRDNLIDNVSMNILVAEEKQDYEVILDKYSFSNEVVEAKDKRFHSAPYITHNGTLFDFAYVEEVSSYAKISQIAIPKLVDGDKEVINIGTKDIKSGIRYSLIGKKIKGTATKSITHSNGEFIYGETKYTPVETLEDERFSLGEMEIKSGTVLPVALLKISDETNVESLSFRLNATNKYYYTNNLNIFAGLKFSRLYGENLPYSNNSYGTFTVSGDYEEYIPSKIEISIYGDTLSLSIEDGEETFGSGNNPFSLNGNELMQDGAISIAETEIKITRIVEGQFFRNYYFEDNNINYYKLAINDKEYVVKKDTSSNELYFQEVGLICSEGDVLQVIGHIEIYQAISKNILSAYSNGKETATLLCSISDYYDYSNPNKKLISKHGADGLPMTFSLHDIVVPMVYQPNGKDAPMSKNGILAKQFEVVVVKMIYDGAVWQELTLQEK